MVTTTQVPNGDRGRSACRSGRSGRGKRLWLHDHAATPGRASRPKARDKGPGSAWLARRLVKKNRFSAGPLTVESDHAQSDLKIFPAFDVVFQTKYLMRQNRP